jgi:hypothetical protein
MGRVFLEQLRGHGLSVQALLQDVEGLARGPSRRIEELAVDRRLEVERVGEVRERRAKYPRRCAR